MNIGSALRSLDRSDEAIAHCRQACQFHDSGYLPHLHLAAALAEAGKTDEALAALDKATQLEPALSIGFVRNHFPWAHETTMGNLSESLRKAGLPEE
ncbi:MAG: hypothetical protein HN478_08620 [Rhodospirillaceae bacterium]|jgi:tetratricopeptide (TPR) repeat protein|nr:hypothetical protein [Rhodospirillaceae bacterium]MBT4490910.1 hypothetical protein [Rhodospirillaceae bacterium]MBT5894552.1 hypothetical protein [Rhodospirillaceae bacterium]MBT6426225.1 hypothetical protein [Rhodospirillaceae bacterium]MBT7759245.1 hypothetical protein [Rhodospirillaceae bacterium]